MSKSFETDIDFNNLSRVENMVDPVSNQDGATKKYVDDSIATRQPLDGDLTAVAGLAGAGFAVRTTTNTWATRSLTTPVGSGLAITNQDGVFGSPAFTNTDKGSDAVAAHVAASDPHPNYETTTELNARDTANRDRANHTGTQLSSTISDFAATVRSTVLTGISFVDSLILATDSILVAIGKLQGQLTQAINNANATFLLKANLAGGNTFTGNQQINDGNLILRDENTGGEPFAWLIGSGGAGNKVGYRFTPFFGRTGGHAAEVGAIDDGNSSAHLLFYTAPTGTATSILERGRFNNDGSFGVGVGAVNAASALVQIDSTTRGFLMPRMTTAQMEAISSPAVGLQIYNTTLNTVCTFNGVTWVFDYCNFTTTTQSTSSTTYANITELVSVSLPAGRYQVYFSGTIQSTSTLEGVGLRLSNGTAGVGAVVMDWSLTQAGNGTDKNFQYTQISTASNFTSTGITVANGDVPAFGLGIIQLTTAGTLAVQIRTETGVAASCSIRANSVISYRRVSA